MDSDSQRVLDLFRETGAYLQGHFRLTSGLHSPEYLQCAKVLRFPRHAAEFGRVLADKLSAQIHGKPDLVVAPAMGGLIIGHEVARAFDVPFLFTEREGGQMSLRRGFQVEPGQTAVLVEDVVTTGGSSREVIELLRSAGARVAAAGSIMDRSGGAADLGVPRVALCTLTAVTFAESDCPLCLAGQPVAKPGSRAV